MVRGLRDGAAHLADLLGELAGGGDHQHERALVALGVAERVHGGQRNAAVLPVPVLAAAMRSRPSSTRGMACSWTGVGVL